MNPGAAIKLGLVWPFARKHPERLEPWADKCLRAQSLRAIDHPVQVIDPGCPRRGDRRDRAVRLIGNQCHDGTLQTQVIEHARQPAIVRDIGRIEHRHFHPVKSGLFQCLEHGHVVLGHVPGPQQQVHADFHGTSAFLAAFEEPDHAEDEEQQGWDD